MRHVTTFLIALLFSSVALAQVTDIPLVMVSGVYTVKAQMAGDSDTSELCVVRVDLPQVIEFGCVPAAANEIVSMDIVVTVTENDDAEIRVYAVDTGGLVSEYSPNAGIIDFTRPTAPMLIP